MTRLVKIRRVLLYTLVLNITVAAVKTGYGYTINSVSMLSDGFHSFFDGTSNIIGLVGIWIASRPPDSTHPYGHRKFETLSTIGIAVLIFAAAAGILKEAYSRLSTPHDIEVTMTGFIIMGITLLVNIWVMTYETRKGRELKSEFLLADALHTKSDIFISISVIISLIAAKMGYPIIDIIAAVFITALIAKMGFSILMSATRVLTDGACIDPKEIKRVIMNVDGVRDSHDIRTRGSKSFVNIDLHVLVDPETTTSDAHVIAHNVEDTVKKEYPVVNDVIVHIEPYDGKKTTPDQ
ncbi:MAG TPA: cation transporter [Nitrospirae bacterium]|nr:putative cation efflux system protein/MT2084 [bacterium BMS3Bbin09]HDZ84620.1 cation transporter [Nitrospirota bacterium]